MKPYFLSVLGYHVNSVLATRWVHGKFLKGTWSGELNKCVQQLSISITTLQFFTTFDIKHSLVVPKVDSLEIRLPFVGVMRLETGISEGKKRS